MPGEERRLEARRLVEEVPSAPARPAGQAGVEGAGERVNVEARDVGELREVLRAVSEFLREIREPLEKLIATLQSTMDGSKLGDDVASFYRKLRESGMPEDMAVELTKSYFKARLESFNLMALLEKAVRLREGGAGEE